MGYYEEYEIVFSYWVEYYCEVVDKATKLGYSEKQVSAVIDDIMYHYYNGKTVDEVMDIEF